MNSPSMRVLWRHLINISLDEHVSIITALFALILLLAPDGAYGLSKQVRSPVYGILTGNGYNGCMVKIGQMPYNTGLDCPNESTNWVTLDCEGEWMHTLDAANNFKTAQLALALDQRITVTIDDRFKAGKYCLAKQIILIKE